MILEIQKQLLIQKAKDNYGTIYPIENKKLEDSFSIETFGNIKKIIFWYNTEDKNTHIEQLNIKD